MKQKCSNTNLETVDLGGQDGHQNMEMSSRPTQNTGTIEEF
jgi:hypothetical protein